MDSTFREHSQRFVTYSKDALKHIVTTYSLFNSGLFADLTLLLSDTTEMKVHKFVVCRCDFFKAACSGNLKVRVVGSRYKIEVDILTIGSTRESHWIP